MKGKRFLNTKNVVIGLISCVLIGASATGVTIFLKDRGEAAAAQQQEPIQNLPVTGSDVEGNEQTDENIDTSTENPEISVGGDETSIGEGEEETTGETTTIPDDTTTPEGTTSEEEIIAGITETVVEQERKVYEDLELSWTTIAIPAITTNMGIYKPELQIEKTAIEVIKAETGEIIEVDSENKPRVRLGDTIIFKIEVSNVGNYKATNVVVTDSLDVIFEDEKIEAGNPLATIETLDYGKKATLKVAYEVTDEDVNATEIIDDVEIEKNIYNVAYATDGKTTVEDDDDMPVNPDIEVSGTKTWDDARNQDGKRPESITVRLWGSYQDEEIANQIVVPDENGDWKYAFVKLPKYDEENNVITYTITEDDVAEYETKMDGYDIVNIHEPETTSISGSKTWDDADNQDGKRPESITIRLLANGEEVETATVTAEDQWSWTFTELPVYEAGNEITYTISEDEVAEYESNVDGFNVTNTHEPETTEVSGSKTWDDNDNQDGKRPESITIRLLANGEEVKTATVTAEDQWSWTFTELPVYEAGNEITYTISEDEVAEYESNVDGFNVTNTHEPETTRITGSKTWEDSDDQDGKRPESITIRLLANGEEVETATVTAEDDWEWLFTELPVYESGKQITYTITEDEVEGYETKTDGYDVTNSYTPETTSVSGSKTWDDADDQDGKRPESITIRLLANGKEVKTATVTAEDQWAWTFTELPVYEAGNEITYTITEDEVTGYETKINGYDVTNSYTPEKTSISGKKTWNDNDDEYGNRPESITINLWANKEWVAEKNVTMNEEWAWSFADLPVYESGNLIDYTITENPVLGYTTQVNKHDVTNTTETIKVSGVKTWENKGNNDVPSSITVNLLENGKEIDEKTITANDNWSYEFTNLPKYKNSELVNYTVTEDAITDYVPSYTTTIADNGDKTINIKNTWEQDLTGKIITIKQTPVPLDVIFVLDISSSMLEKDGDNVTRAQDMVEATNEAIQELMKNQNNRVSVVLYNSDVYQLTDSGSLKHYNADKNGNYITYKTVNETYVGGKITFSNGNTVNVSTSAYREGSLKCGTYTQGGIKTATQIFNNSKDSTGTRKPVMILLTDGDPTHYDTNLNYNKYGTKYPTVGEGIAKLRYITAEYYAYTMKTMENCKSKITGFYGGKNCEVYTVGINMRGSMAKALLQPSSENIGSLKNTTNISPEIHNHGDSGEKTQYSVVDSDGLWRKDAEYYKYQSNRLNTLVTSGTTKVSNNYANKAYTESTSGDISENFDDIVNTITETVTTIITSEHYGNDRRIKLEGFNPNNNFTLKITQNSSDIVNTSDISKVDDYIIQDDGYYYLTLTNISGKVNIEMTYYK